LSSAAVTGPDTVAQSRLDTGRVSVASENGAAPVLVETKDKEEAKKIQADPKGSIADFMPSLNMGFMSDMFPDYKPSQVVPIVLTSS